MPETSRVLLLLLLLLLLLVFSPWASLGRDQSSGDWYGSVTLHPGQVLRGSFAIAFPRFITINMDN